MNGLEVSKEVLKLSRKIEALERVLLTLESNQGFNYEKKVLKELQDEIHEQKSNLEDKLRSVNF